MRLAALLAALLALAGAGLGALVGSAVRGPAHPWLAPADQVAAAHGWQGGRIDAGYFMLTAFRRFDGSAGGTLVVYIEGDGHPWESQTELSDDPSPRTPGVLALAVRDPSPSVAYFARPCHYLSAAEYRFCPSYVWSLSRYADYVVASLDAAVDSLKAEADAETVRLVGHGGGGTLAALVAARRDDVEGLVTIAANLDHDVWTTRHGTMALLDSVNAADVAEVIEDVPQVHFVGGRDRDVTRAEVDAYVARMADASRTEVVMVPQADHTCCWADLWPGLLDGHLPALD